MERRVFGAEQGPIRDAAKERAAESDQGDPEVFALDLEPEDQDAADVAGEAPG